jgi:hypothetical protein
VTAAWKVGISPKAKSKAPALDRPSPRSAEFRRLGRQVAALALIRTSQGGRLNVRQKEELRRALAEAGEVLLWNELTVGVADPVAVVSDELVRVTKSGVRVIEKEVEVELKEKKSEMKRLEVVVAKARKLAESKNPKLPTEISYSHTARAAAQGLVTKTETVTITAADEAGSCADQIEKSLNRWESLRDQMVDELQRKQAQIEIVQGNVPEFVKSQVRMIKEVMAVLH